jgi:hypothetical protein
MKQSVAPKTGWGVRRILFAVVGIGLGLCAFVRVMVALPLPYPPGGAR